MQNISYNRSENIKLLNTDINDNKSYSSTFFNIDYYCKSHSAIGINPQQLNFQFKLPQNELKHKLSFGSVIKWIERPTGNCQVSTIGYFNNIIATANNIIYNYDRDQKIIKHEDILACFIRYLQNHILYIKGYEFKLLLLDINQSYGSQYLEPFIKKYNLSIKFKNPYASSNGSSMICYLIDMRNFNGGINVPDIFTELFIPKPKTEPKSINGSRIIDLQLTHVRKDTYICDTCKESISPGKVYKALKDNKYVYFHTKCIINK